MPAGGFAPNLLVKPMSADGRRWHSDSCKAPLDGCYPWWQWGLLSIPQYKGHRWRDNRPRSKYGTSH